MSGGARGGPLPSVVREALVRCALPPRARIVVALSGGLDSVVLLHLLRHGGAPADAWLHAAHFDHAMRAGSADDARWVAGLCTAWGVGLSVARAGSPPTSEQEAREARYGFLERVRAEVGGHVVVTAHHADDQAETVLFRALRGTGPEGLAGIPPLREPALLRPLLGVWREELVAYAASQRLTWRDDPTNGDPAFVRNAIRGRILPEVERLVAPGARRALVRLAELVREDEAGWLTLVPALLEPLDVREELGGLSFDRAALLTLHPAVQARILRYLSGGVGARFDEATTRSALSFAASAPSGRRAQLGGGWALHRELDRLALREARSRSPDVPLAIPDVGPGSGEAVLAGERIRVLWGGEAKDAAGPSGPAERFDTDQLRFPLVVRAREPGDRIRLPGGTKKVKKLFLERRIPAAARDRTPLVVDAGGDVLWIPEVARADVPRGRAPFGALRIEIG